MALLFVGLVAVREAEALQASGSRSGARPTRGYSVGLAERSSTSTAFFEPEPGLNEERTRGVFEPDEPVHPVIDVEPEPIEDYWEPYIKSARVPYGHMTPDRLRSSDLNELLQPDFMEEKRYGISPMQARRALAVPCPTHCVPGHTHCRGTAMLRRRYGAPSPQRLTPCLRRPSGRCSRTRRC